MVSPSENILILLIKVIWRLNPELKTPAFVFSLGAAAASEALKGSRETTARKQHTSTEAHTHQFNCIYPLNNV